MEKNMFWDKQKKLIAGLIFIGLAAGAAVFAFKRKRKQTPEISFSYHNKKQNTIDKETLKQLLRYMHNEYLSFISNMVKYERKICKSITSDPLKRMSSNVIGSLVEQDYSARVNNVKIFSFMVYNCNQDNFNEALETEFKNDKKIQELNQRTKVLLEKAYKGHDPNFEQLPEKYLTLDTSAIANFLIDLYIEQDLELLKCLSALKAAGETKLNFLNKNLMAEVRRISGSEVVEKRIQQRFPEISKDDEVYINFYLRIEQLMILDNEAAQILYQIKSKKVYFDENILKNPSNFNEDFIKNEYYSLVKRT